MAGSEIKGIWFLVAREQVHEQFGAARLDELVKSVPAAHRLPLLEPLASSWYPEAALQAALAGMREVLAPGDAQLRGLLHGCTRRGVGRFFRAMMRLSSPEFMLRQVPTMWRHIRRDRAQIDVDLGSPTTRITYRGFPYFYDLNYRILVEGSLGALVEPTRGRKIPVVVEDFGDDWLRVSIHHG